MNMNNVDANTAASAVKRPACQEIDASDYHLHNEGKKNIAEQTLEQFCDKLQLPLLLNKTSSSQISHSHSEQMPRNLLNKIKKRRRQNSKSLKNVVTGKPEKDKTQETEGSTNASERQNCDVEYPVPIHIQPVSCGESVLNSSILDEILSEKKRILLESSEMNEFLQTRLRT